jgi:enoyl-CoA hydratase/carnithine racemase
MPNQYQHVELDRDGGVLIARLHSDGGPLRWSSSVHEELGRFFAAVGNELACDVVVITGTGETFIGSSVLTTFPWGKTGMTPGHWDVIYNEGQRLITGMLGIPVPVVVAINGPAVVHSELAVLGDLALATPDTFFQDSHFTRGLVPGDGVHVVWPAVLGHARARQYLLLGKPLTAEEAMALGIVCDVVDRDELLERAVAMARELAQQNDLVRRYTRSLLTVDLRSAVAAQLALGLALEGLAHPSWAGPGHDAASVDTPKSG